MKNPEKSIRTESDVFHHFSADYDPQADHETNQQRLSRRIYKDTTCGAWAKTAFLPRTNLVTFTVGSIVEGIDACTEVQVVELPCTPADLDAAVEAVEKEARDLWNETHGCDDCGPEGDGGFRAVDPACKACGGSGVSI